MAPPNQTSLRSRLALGGAVAVALATAASAGVDRALVLAELPPPVRFAAASLVLLCLLIVPLMMVLERWVLRPLEALREVHRQSQGGRVPKLSRTALSRMPAEFRDAVQQQLTLLETLSRTNERLQNEVVRRTAVLEAIVAGSDAILTAPAENLGPRLVSALAAVSGDALPALLLPTPAGIELHIALSARLDPASAADIEARLEEDLADGHALQVHWHEGRILHESDPVHSLRVLHRVPLEGASSHAALMLLTHMPADFKVSTSAVRRTLHTLAHQLSLRIARDAAQPSPGAETQRLHALPAHSL